MANRNGFALDYIDVASRIVEFREKFPDGSLQQVALDFREVAGGWWVIYTAAAYRTPDDARPGIGTAWEPVPGKTNFTRDSEVQNAETAAWGRAIVAALAADTKRGIASAEEVRNRTAVQSAVSDYVARGGGHTDAGDIPESESFSELSQLIDGATTKAELAAIGKRIAASDVEGNAREQLRIMFSARQKAIA